MKIQNQPNYSLPDTLKDLNPNPHQVSLFVKVLHEEGLIDLTNYALGSLQRRVSRLLQLEGYDDIEQLSQALKTGKMTVQYFTDQITVNVTELFRDPKVWAHLRSIIIPALVHRFGALTIWHAGCSTGEEVCSMQILLSEMGIKVPIIIFGTDVSRSAIIQAKNQLYASRHYTQFNHNYQAVFGSDVNIDKYITKDDNGNFSFNIKQPNIKVIYANQDMTLTTRGINANLVMCRNVLIYFNTTLQAKVLNEITLTLPIMGVLVLGAKETIASHHLVAKMLEANAENRIYKKIG